MDLVVFDLDGTLLNKQSQISSFTRETLSLMQAKGITYTVATGRTLHAAHDIIEGHGFDEPHIYSNGVIMWDPAAAKLSLNNALSQTELDHILAVAMAHHITPFVSVVDTRNQHYIYHSTVKHRVEAQLLELYQSRQTAKVISGKTPNDALITNISFLGKDDTIDQVKSALSINSELIAYSGEALEGQGLSWMDVHHSDANKGTAVEYLGKQLGASNIICFGDNDNDLSMFNIAHESYATDNAIDAIKQAASRVIGHHDNDGVAHFLRERFAL